MTRPDSTPQDPRLFAEIRCVNCRATFKAGADAVKFGRPVACPECGEETALRHTQKNYPYRPSTNPGAGLKANPWPTPNELKR